TEQGLGQILGREYVRHLFPPEARARAVSLVHQIAGTLRSQLQQLSWMTEPTRRHAIAKLDAMTFKIGYPDQWPAADPPEIRRDRFVENMRRLARAEAAQNLATAGASARRDDWTVPAHTMNAYYEHESNELVLPAGILQPPL